MRCGFGSWLLPVLLAPMVPLALAAGCSSDSNSDPVPTCQPTAEQCNGLDDDCDGYIDEAPTGDPLTQPCQTPDNKIGSQTCVGASWSQCTGDCTPQTEICNDQDDDCDGQVDEGDTGQPLTQDCSNDCGLGTEVCVNGQFVQCTAPQPSDEVCDGVDNDCDGNVDDGFDCAKSEQRPCGTSVGVCEQGTQTCGNDCTWGACQGAVEPGTEACDGVLDEDCDGSVDEGCGCSNGQQKTCCGGSQVTCTGGVWPACPAPPVETCNALDDDCDGETDNNLPASPYLGDEDISLIDNCAHAKVIPTPIVELDPATTLGPYYLYKQNLSADRDFFQIQTEELSDIECVIHPDWNECYTLNFILSEPAGTNYEFRVHYVGNVDNGPYTDCASPIQSHDSTNNQLALSWAGGCGINDNLVFYVEVYAVSAEFESCQSYTLDLQLVGSGPQEATCS